VSADVAVRNPISDWDRGPGTWDLTWDLGLGTWDLGLGTWDLGPGTWNQKPESEFGMPV
jgi:hypothetical protein